MNSPASSCASWLRTVLKAAVVPVLVAAAFFAGWSIGQRRWESAIRQAQDAAQQARRQEALAIRELRRELSKVGGLPPPLPGKAVPQQKSPLDIPTP
jgi:hypothetical protein